jgi:hypothetical protein
MGLRSSHPESAIPTVLPTAHYVSKYTGETNLAVWLEDFRLACQAGGADDDYFIIQYLPICVGEYVQAWLKFLPSNSIRSWAELKHIFVGNFQERYVRPENSWDVKSCKQERGESLQDYISRFTKQCSSLP